MNVDAVAGASTEMHLAKVQVEASTSVLKKSMDFGKDVMQQMLTDMMPQIAMAPRMDIRV